MRVLLDENVPRKLKYRLAPEHEAVTVPEQGWSGLLNGALLLAADAEFDALAGMFHRGGRREASARLGQFQGYRPPSCSAEGRG